MEKLINILCKDLDNLNFKEVSALVGNIEIDKKDKDNLNIIINTLKNDKRKNMNSLGIKLEKKLEKLEKEIIRVTKMYEFDKSFNEKIVAGVDEVGRGPLAGPIVSCAVILDLESANDIILEINDSKKLTEAKRDELSEKIKEKALSYNIAIKDNDEIDERGIAYCNNQIFIEACAGLKYKPDIVLSDGYLIKNYKDKNQAVIKGDTKSASIACASILAKVYRDNLMKKYHKDYPEYAFNKNVGYGTRDHIEALKGNGITKIHRKSFLKNIMEEYKEI